MSVAISFVMAAKCGAPAALGLEHGHGRFPQAGDRREPGRTLGQEKLEALMLDIACRTARAPFGIGNGTFERSAGVPMAMAEQLTGLSSREVMAILSRRPPRPPELAGTRTSSKAAGS